MYTFLDESQCTCNQEDEAREQEEYTGYFYITTIVRKDKPYVEARNTSISHLTFSNGRPIDIVLMYPAPLQIFA
jgi:hypothetical protein